MHLEFAALGTRTHGQCLDNAGAWLGAAGLEAEAGAVLRGGLAGPLQEGRSALGRVLQLPHCPHLCNGTGLGLKGQQRGFRVAGNLRRPR